MWQDEARQWLRDVLPAANGLDIEVVRERGWGAIWKVTADGGQYWFKRPHPSLWREVRLRRMLQRRVPHLVLPVVADDAGRGWMVTAGQGPTLAPRAREQGPHVYGELAAAMARIQRSVTTADLAGLDLPVFDPHDAVARLEDMLGPFAALPAGHPAHLTPADREIALERQGTVVERWARLDVEVPGLTLDHNDLHAGNAFPGPRISDWGDAVIGHPFCSLRALLVPARTVFGREALGPIRSAYLAEFGELPGDHHRGRPADRTGTRAGDRSAGSPRAAEALQEALGLAMMLAVPQRLAAWRAVQDPLVWAEYAHYITPLWREAGAPVEQVSVP
jgi:hypothetical protein